MKRRYSYLLLFGVPALLASLIVSLLLFGAAAGMLWIFVWGDNPWPSATEKILAVMFVVGCVTMWVALLAIAYAAGKRQEARAALNTGHVLAAAGATALLVLLVVAQQWNVGNIGTRSDGVRCADFCRDKGFAGSTTPPRNAGAPTCGCLDAQGREAVKIPMAERVGGPGK